MSSIMRARSALIGGAKDGRSSGAPLSSRRLLDLRCSGSDAPIVTPYRLPARYHPQKFTDRDARHPARAGSFSGQARQFGRVATTLASHLRLSIARARNYGPPLAQFGGPFT